MINSFIIYRLHFNSKKENSCPYTHKEFNVEVSWNWILKGTDDTSDNPNTASQEALTARNNIHVTDNAILPCRQSRSDGIHLPIAGNEERASGVDGKLETL